MAVKTPKAPRPPDEMVESLRRHVRLLEEYAEQAFHQGNSDFAGEIAGKLRLLVVKFRSNEPLLLRLMEAYSSDIRVTLAPSPIKYPPEDEWMAKPMTIEQYLGLHAVTIRIPTGELVSLTNTQLIRAWAEQSGSAHEDWDMDESLRAIMTMPLVFFGLSAPIYTLRAITGTVLFVAQSFLQELDASAA